MNQKKNQTPPARPNPFTDPEGWAQYMIDRTAEFKSSNPQTALFETIATQSKIISDAQSEIISSQKHLRQLKREIHHDRPPISWSRGYLPIPLELILADDISSSAKLLWILIYRYSFLSKTKSSWPSQTRLASELGTTSRQVQRLLFQLVNAGYLSISARIIPGSKVKVANCYYLNLEELSTVKRPND